MPRRHSDKRTSRHAGADQLAEDVAAAGTAKPPLTPGVSPKTPNAPPAPKAAEVPCAGQSFTPDTLVLLADGTSRPIAQISVGDLVWSTDVTTGQSAPQTVQAVLVNRDTDLLDLTITNTAREFSVINTTSGHPFYSPSRTHNTISGLTATTTPTQVYGPGWTDAQDLRPGDALYTPNGAGAQVESTTPAAGAANMWDLTIETTHTFYITTPAASVLVHNCPMPAPKSTPTPNQPKGGVYVIHDKDMNPVYVGRSRDVDSRLLAHAGPNGKLRAGDSVQVYRTDSRLARRGLEQRLMDQHRTLNPPSRPVPGSLGRNSIRGVRVGHPKTKKFDQAADRFLSSQQRDPDISRLPQQVQRRLDARGQAQRSADTQRATAQSSARDANQPSRSSGSDQSGSSGRSADKQDKDTKKDKKSKQNHKKPNGK